MRQALRASLVAVNQTVAGVPSPTPYLSLLDPAVAAYAALPSPPGDVLSGLQSTFGDIVATIETVRLSNARPARGVLESTDVLQLVSFGIRGDVKAVPSLICVLSRRTL